MIQFFFFFFLQDTWISLIKNKDLKNTGWDAFVCLVFVYDGGCSGSGLRMTSSVLVKVSIEDNG